ncbi:MAG TPA: hypothetical protein EYG02_07265 [Henriciella marina]|uniref:hypothetical protein n=1 Tax=Henriciella sp. TaxID=1968823 RepID=UPI0017C8B7FD|nr:hypothetical protein [Henriciella sp.]HIG23662.1 hypothetical protein [Henriciella sp.]HIK64813.1 hypothetical protein [Henriciella marina]
MRHSLPLSILILSTILPAAAQEASSFSTREVYACADLSDDAARLACYDEAVGRLKSAEETGEAVMVTRSEVEEVRRDSFGFSIPSLPNFAASVFGEGEEIDEVSYPVASVQKTSRGELYVTLQNGQVWQQTDNKRIYYSAKRGVDNATIKSAALGSYMMKLDDGLQFRAKRLK